MARGKGRAVWFVALVLSLTLALAHRASAITCSSYAKKACRKNDACQWTGSSCVAPTDVCSGIQAKKVGGVSKKRRCNGKAECRCSGNKKCGTCVANVGVGAPSPSPDGGPACSSPWTVNPGLTCGMVKNTCADWKYLSCAQSGKTCTGADEHRGGPAGRRRAVQLRLDIRHGHCRSRLQVPVQYRSLRSHLLPGCTSTILRRVGTP